MVPIALNDLERSVITWAQVLGSYLYCLGGVSYPGNQGVLGEARAQAQSPVVWKRVKLLSCLRNNQHKRATARPCSIGKPTEGNRCHPQRNLTHVVSRSNVQYYNSLL